MATQRNEISLRVLVKISKYFFATKGSIYFVAIATVVFSHVKILCYFHV